MFHSGDSKAMSARLKAFLAILTIVVTTQNLLGGGSGLNVVVVINTNSANSVELGNYYCERRSVPPQNVLRIGWTGDNRDWYTTNLDTVIRAPLTNMLAARQLTNQIDYILLSMDIPFRARVTTGSSTTSGINTTTSALFYGFKADGCNSCPAGLPSCNLPDWSSNSYAGSEGIFRKTPPVSATSNSWLTIMLTFSNLADAKAIVDRGVAGDFSFPTQTAYLAKSFDTARNIRYFSFDNAIFNTRLQGNYSLIATNASSPNGLGTMLGFQIGVQTFPVSGSFVPGALADNLTSYGGDFFVSDHTGVMSLLNAGATACYGTAIEPCAYEEKFPSPLVYFYQSRGFTAAECYYQSVTNPYQGVLVGEPLTAPFALPASGAWDDLPDGALLSGTTNLGLTFNAPDASRPIQQVDLFVDGTFFQTVTNIPPRTNNVLYVTINGFPTNYSVPANASIKSVASNLAVRLNGTAYSTATKVHAYNVGDRIELRVTSPNQTGAQTSLLVSNHVGTATTLMTFVRSAGTNFLDSEATGIRTVAIAGSVVTNDYLFLTVTKTNGATVSVGVTNLVDGTTLNQFVQQFVGAINGANALQGNDGLIATDIAPSRYLPNGYDFNLHPRVPAVQAALIQVIVDGSFSIYPTGAQLLDQNLADLQPRQHLYVTAGLTNLPLTFPVNTTSLANGFHELTAVAYEGSHVRTQKRISQTVRVQNSPLSAVFACLLCDTNTALEATLQFSVTANTNTISRIELFSTGGSWGISSNSQAATFSVVATNLGAGLHPFYAIVTRNDGIQYRTETKWIRLTASEQPFAVSIAGATPTLSWPATAGRRYEILSATNVDTTLSLRDAVIPTNSPGFWSETNNASTNRFYRVRSAP